MKRKHLELVGELSKLDNNSLEQIAIKFYKVIEDRRNKLLSAVSNKDTSVIIELSDFFKNDSFPLDISKKLCKLDYNKNDRDFCNYLMNLENYPITGNSREKILYQYLSQSLIDNDFYQTIKNDYPQEMKEVIKTKFTKDSLKNVSPDIFLELIQICDLKLSLNNFKEYVENDSLPILKKIVESGVFSKFLNINNEKIKNLALSSYQEKTTDFLISKFNMDKKVSFFFSDDTSAEEFCKNSKINFFTYVLNNFDFENNHKYTMYFMHHLGKTKSEEKWKIGIDCLVKNHIDNPDFIEQVKLKIELSQIEKYKEVARIQFQTSFLNASLPFKKDISKQMKI